MSDRATTHNLNPVSAAPVVGPDARRFVWPRLRWLWLGAAVAVLHVSWRGQQHAARIAALLDAGSPVDKPLAVKLANEIGFWAIWALLGCLAVSPLAARWPAQPGHQGAAPAAWRRALGLAAAGLGALHMLVYALAQPTSWRELASRLADQPWQWLGAAAAALLLPLALTSNRAAMRRLGSRWKLLHRLVYPATVAVVLHYALRADATRWHWQAFALLAALLLLARVVPRPLRRRSLADR